MPLVSFDLNTFRSDLCSTSYKIIRYYNHDRRKNMNRIQAFFFTFILCTVIPVPGLAQQDQNETTKSVKASFKKTVAVLHPTEGNTSSGTVTFTKVEEGIRIEADLSGLREGMHGFHIHEYGDCTAADGTSAGGHFNPAGSPHAGPEDSPRHAGDLGNVTVGADGTASYSRVDDIISFQGDHNILGHAVIVHEKKDDLSSQPTGDAGGSLSCGVIGIANTEKE